MLSLDTYHTNARFVPKDMSNEISGLNKYNPWTETKLCLYSKYRLGL